MYPRFLFITVVVLFSSFCEGQNRENRRRVEEKNRGGKAAGAVSSPVTPRAADSAGGKDESASGEKGPAKKPAAGAERIVVMAAGDIMLQRRCLRSAAQRAKGMDNNFGYDELFPRVAAVLSSADLALGNLEFPVFEKTMPSRQLVFHGTPPALRAVKKAGFTVLSSANNHAYDHGRISPASTARLCRAEAVTCVGVGENQEQAQRPWLATIKGARVAVVAYTLVTNANLNSKKQPAPHVNGYRFDELLAQVQAARKISDGVIVTIHWGAEYRTQPLAFQKDMARKLTAAGAVLILGHHPHVLEPLQAIPLENGRTALVAYSLGNFISNQAPGSPAAATRLAAILRVELVNTDGGLTVAAWDSIPTWIQNQNTRWEGKPVEDLHVEVLPPVIADLQAELAGKAESLRKAALQRRLRFYEERTAAAEKVLLLPRGP